MGKGAGTGTRPGLCLGSSVADTAGASIGVPSEADLREQLRNARSSVDRAVILAQWNRDRPLVPEALGTQEQYVQSRIDAIRDETIMAIEFDVMGLRWREQIMKEYAAEHHDDYRIFKTELNQLKIELDRLQDKQWELQEKSENTYDDDKHARMQKKIRQLEEQLVEKRDRRTTLIRQSDALLQQYTGAIVDGEYQPGEADLQALFDQHQTTYQDRIDQQYREWMTDFKTACEMMYELNADIPPTSQSPNWQPQDLSAIEDVLNDHDRAILFDGGLLHDDVAYLSRKRRREEVMGYQSEFDIEDTETAVKKQLKKVAPDIDTKEIRWYAIGELRSRTETPTVDEWYEQFITNPHMKERFTEDQVRTISELASKHAVFIEQRPTKLFFPGVESVWCESEVRPQREEALIKQLIDAGAERVDGSFELPDYESSHVVKPGQQLRLRRDDGSVIEYTPHYNVGAEYGNVTTYHARHDFASEKSKQHLKEIFDQEFVRDRGGPLNEWIVMTDSAGHRRVIEQHYCPVKDTIPIGKSVEMFGDTYTAATEADLKDAGCFQVADGWVDKERIEYYRDGQEILKQIAQLPPLVTTGGNEITAREQLSHEAETHSKATPAQKWVANHWYEIQPSITETTQVDRIPMQQEAPYSERGQLRVRSADAQSAVTALSEVGAVGKLHEEVPLGLMHVGGHGEKVMPSGRLTPLRAEYAAGINHIHVPEGKMVLHGMTGVYEAHQARERLDMLIQSGGLLSIAERSRRGMRMRSMSPMGDIASGIDRGVPCSIQDTSKHGQHIYFALKPHVLERRDVWFSDRDFGGGESRYDKYSQYAQSIGQRRIHESPNHAARQRHLKGGISRGDNEVYFKDGISLHEIDTIFVGVHNPKDFNTQLEALVQAKRRGDLPQSVRVECVNKSSGGFVYSRVFPTIDERIADRAARYNT